MPSWSYRFHTLPRQSHEILLLLAVLAWVLLPQALRLPWWCSALAAGVLLWRAVLVWQRRALPGRVGLLGLLGLAIAGIVAEYGTIVGRDPGVAMAVVLLTLKTLELRWARDVWVVFLLSLFTLLANCFYSQSLLTALHMLVGLWALLTVLIANQIPAQKPPWRALGKTAAALMLWGIPTMLVLFMLFPRLSPLWGMSETDTQKITGLSERMEMGHMGQLALDSSVAMRIRFDGPVPEPAALYFRGPVLTEFDGQTWRPEARHSASPTDPDAQPTLQVRGPSTTYQVTLEPHKNTWLTLLDAAPKAPRLTGYSLRQSADLQWRVERPVTQLLRYQAESYPQYRYGVQLSAADLAAALALPAGYNPRTRAWADEGLRTLGWRNLAPMELVEVVLAQIKTQGFSYTLEPGAYGVHAVDEFWLDRREGFCEHFASAFVVLMRALGVPARIVTGYQGGELNALDGNWTVRQSDAHAWAEVWVAQKGWVRVDPTASVAPNRIASLTRLRAPSSPLARVLDGVDPNFHRSLRQAWESINNQWNQWVLDYSQARQFKLLQALGFSQPDWRDLNTLLTTIFASAMLLGVAWMQWRSRRQDPWLRLLYRAQVKLRKAGIPAPPQASPAQLAALLARKETEEVAKNPQLRACHDWLWRLEAWRYAASGGSRTELLRLRREFKHLPWPHSVHAGQLAPRQP